MADAGYRVAAPFVRRYEPSSVPSDSSFHVGALMDDALRLREAAGPTDRDVLIGHDWGAIAAAGIAAMPDNPFRHTVLGGALVAPRKIHGHNGSSATESGCQRGQP